MVFLRWLAAIGVLLLQPQVQATDWEYAVRPGDSIWTISSRFCGSHRHSAVLVRHNGLEKDAQVRAGSVLRIPVSCLAREPASARLIESAADARVVHEGQGIEARVGAPINMGDTLITESGFVVVEFADGSKLTVRPHSEVQFVLLSAYGESGMVDTLTRLRKGRVQHATEPGGSKGHRHRIATPVGAAAVRGTAYRVDIPEAGKTTVATTRGEVGYEQGIRPVLPLPAGTGVVATAEGANKSDLLPAPELPRAIRKGQGKLIEWGAVAAARGFRITLEGAGVPLLEAVVAEPRWIVEAPPGHYTFVVRAIAADDLEGLDAVAPLEVLQAGPSGLGTESGPDSVRLRWRAAGEGPFTARIARMTDDGENAEEIAAQPDGLQTQLPPGAYRWQVKSAASDWSDPAEFVVSPGVVTGLVVRREDSGRSVKGPVRIEWTAPAHDVTGFGLRVRSGNTLVVDREIAGDVVLLDELRGIRCSPCSVEVTTRAAGLESDYTQAEFRDRPGHPWPLYLVLPLLLLGL
jgi:hypothetical protein